jgi:hypothetical protein
VIRPPRRAASGEKSSSASSSSRARSKPAPRDDRLHQLAPDPTRLDIRSHRDGSDSSDGIALIKKVGADDSSVFLGHDAEDRGMVNEPSGELHRVLEGLKITGKPMLVMKALERLKENAPAGLRIGSGNGTNRDAHRGETEANAVNWRFASAPDRMADQTARARGLPSGGSSGQSNENAGFSPVRQDTEAGAC